MKERNQKILMFVLGLGSGSIAFFLGFYEILYGPSIQTFFNSLVGANVLLLFLILSSVFTSMVFPSLSSRYVRPKLKLESISTENMPRIVRFKVYQSEEIVEKQVRFSYINIVNVGKSTAEKPYLALMLYEEIKNNKETIPIISIRKDRNHNEYAALETYTKNPVEREFAITLYEKGLSSVTNIEPSESELFVLGFRFLDSDNFWLCNWDGDVPGAINTKWEMFMKLIGKTPKTYEDLGKKKFLHLISDSEGRISFTHVSKKESDALFSNLGSADK